MPTINFKGKEAVWDHHLEVPCHTLEAVEAMSFQKEKGEENLIVEGDNLLAIKALMPEYAGKVKCIYIDPPYNTGHGGWVYNDSVNSPLINEWLGKIVNKKDLSRHDKWLCMMTPRLQLLREMLHEEGAIFISLDENEVFNCKALMDEIFGAANFRNLAIVRKGAKNVQAQFETVERLNYAVEYVLIYSKDSKFRFKKFEIPLEKEKPGSWNNHWRGTDRPTMRYELFGITPERGQWRWSQKRSMIAVENYKQLQLDLGKSNGSLSQKEIDKWYESKGEKIDLLRVSKTGKPEHFVPPTGTRLANSNWSDLKPNGSRQLRAIFGDKVFDNPKSTDLIKRCIQFAEGADNQTLVLDSFAGSGSTMQAVMELNKADGGNRKCILIQMNEGSGETNICRDITRKRNEKAIEKFGFESGFQYLKLKEK